MFETEKAQEKSTLAGQDYRPSEKVESPKVTSETVKSDETLRKDTPQPKKV